MKLLSQFESRGNIELLSQKSIAVFSSKNTPREIYKSAEEIFLALCQLPVSIAGGWQAPLEKYLLDLTTVEMPANIIFYSAKDLSVIKNERLTELEKANKVLFISAESKKKRAAKRDVNKRDELLLSQVNAVLFLYIETAGRLEKYFDKHIQNKLAVFVLEHERNIPFINAGAVGLNRENMNDLIHSLQI